MVKAQTANPNLKEEGESTRKVQEKIDGCLQRLEIKADIKVFECNHFKERDNLAAGKGSKAKQLLEDSET